MDHLTPGDDPAEGATPDGGPGGASQGSAREPGPAPDHPAVSDEIVVMTIHPDAAVVTEAVDTPTVVFAPLPEAPGPRRVGGRLSVVVGVIWILVFGGVAAFGYTLSQDLATTRTTLASTEADLSSTRSTLEATTSDLATTTAERDDAAAQRGDLDATISDLAAQVADQTECVALQADALVELARIETLQTANFNRTSETSTWAKSADTRAKAVSNALDAWYQAYSKAFDGNISSARGWAAKGKDAEAVIAAQAKQQAAELALIDRSAAEIQAALDALEKQLVELEAACGEVAR